MTRFRQLQHARIKFMAWMELPYYVGLPFETSTAGEIAGKPVELKIAFRNDLLRVLTWNRWSCDASKDEPTGWGENWIQGPQSTPQFFPRYCPTDSVSGLADDLHAAGAPYVHVDELETVVEVTADIDGRLPNDAWDSLNELHPMPSLFTDVVLPHVADAIDSYRVSALPAMRYRLHPVTEAVVSRAFAEFRTVSDEILMQIDYGLDSRENLRSMQHYVHNLGVEDRFHEVYADLDQHDLEVSLSTTYCLLHMRRVSEALTVASAAVDEAIRRVVMSRIAPETLAEVTWKVFRTRTEDVLKKLLPSTGFPSLPDVNPDLWKRFTSARATRGLHAHSVMGRTNSPRNDAPVRDMVRAFVDVSRWIALEAGWAWKLDVEEDGSRLRELP